MEFIEFQVNNIIVWINFGFLINTINIVITLIDLNKNYIKLWLILICIYIILTKNIAVISVVLAFYVGNMSAQNMYGLIWTERIYLFYNNYLIIII